MVRKVQNVCDKIIEVKDSNYGLDSAIQSRTEELVL